MSSNLDAQSGETEVTMSLSDTEGQISKECKEGWILIKE
jgi:hypothetical protein